MAAALSKTVAEEMKSGNISIMDFTCSWALLRSDITSGLCVSIGRALWFPWRVTPIPSDGSSRVFSMSILPEILCSDRQQSPVDNSSECVDLTVYGI